MGIKFPTPYWGKIFAIVGKLYLQKTTIMEDITEVENLLKTYLKDNEGISVGLRTDIDLESKVILKQVYNSEGVLESVDLNKDYYRIPGIIDVLVDSKLDGDFICDV
ncbi:MAG: hypothetical protein NUK57_12590, partial [Gudongella sp.]|nr:hypothetical protein [Gudongella sp.]